MTPFDFEKNIKIELEKRALQPSNESWSKLSDRLDKDKKNNSNRLWYFSIAASIILVIFSSFLFFNKEQKITSPILVEVNENETKRNNDSKAEDKHEAKTVELEKNKTPNSVIVNQSEKKNLKKSLLKEQENTLVEITSTTIKNSIPNVNLEIPKLNTSTVVNLSDSNVETSEIVVSTELISENSFNVTDQEIDILLKNAQQQIALQNQNTHIVDTVNANALLEDAELDLEHSFRKKVFKFIGKNYKKLETAIVDSDN